MLRHEPPLEDNRPIPYEGPIDGDFVVVDCGRNAVTMTVDDDGVALDHNDNLIHLICIDPDGGLWVVEPGDILST